ncbi:hypothetical protein KIW84_032559 [Lathyrus oleraceus]|uniref:Retrovirus-related Pol polyprotein from transposon TNT 1-94-like beta-barrel domain-containing protein n=1 Tax=Pisum sativum TaxID=3888 RepID=A0A9D4XTK9_PEA|nr:hypothetical protein KIW84_032559 [Pisum sativum]
METGIGKSYMFLPSAKDVWEAVKETYSDIQNSSQIFGLKSKLLHAKQGDMNVTAYYNELLTLWQELDLCYDDNWRCTKDSFLFLKRQENDRVFMFLVGLNKDLDELKGKPPNWKKKSGCAFHASISDQEQQPPQSQSPLTTVQLDKLYKLLESPTPSCYIATKGNSAFLSVSLSHTWIVDSSASDNMTGESTLFSSYSLCAGNQKIKIADGSFSAIAGKGSVVLSPMLTLKNVLHVPNLSCNLMFVSKLAQDINCQTNFFRSHCIFQDLNSGKMIGNAKENGGLYYLDIGSAS